ncbi:MAG: EAL domain-containing protein [Pseudomonadales bacterium]
MTSTGNSGNKGFATPDAGSLRVLLIDDDQIDRKIVSRYLENSGIRVIVEEASEPVNANDLVIQNKYDCVLMDYRFPGGTAFDYFGKLLAMPCSMRPPVVLLTGQGDERVAAESIALGAQEYLSKKELGMLTIRRAVESACEKAKIQRKLEQHDQELVRMSYFDALTGLPNRRLFFERLDQAVRAAERARRSFILLMLDLDFFKTVNDSFGHAAGDQLLMQIAERVLNLMRDSDIFARIAGDEFAVLLPTTESLEGGIIVAEKIAEQLTRSFMIGDKIIDISASFGMVQFPGHGSHGEELFGNADIAMYDSKRDGRLVTVFGSEHNRTDSADMLIAQSLKKAFVNRELFVLYQPQLDLEQKTVVGVEALVRWQHPTLGLLPPSKFIPIAEKSAHIETLTLQVLETALLQARDWFVRGINLPVAVNLSASLLNREGLTQKIGDVISRIGVPPGELCLEVTETGIMSSPESAGRVLQELYELGVTISIDDFGTGYSSLKYLRNFPIGEIKIDQLFITDLLGNPRDELIVESVLALGKAFDVRVLAEGVETMEVANRLLELGCKYAQGYYFGRPMTADDLEGLIN